jgi:hypothetical protein
LKDNITLLNGQSDRQLARIRQLEQENTDALAAQHRAEARRNELEVYCQTLKLEIENRSIDSASTIKMLEAELITLREISVTSKRVAAQASSDLNSMKFLVCKALEESIKSARTLNVQHFKKNNVKYNDFAEKNSHYGGSDADDESHRSSDVTICHDGELREGHFGVYYGDHL